MKQPQPISTIDEELAHVPKHPKEHQRELRMFYNIARRISLGKKPERERTRQEVMRRCAEDLKTRHPDYEPSFDREYFG
jgi:hypothetical protein